MYTILNIGCGDRKIDGAINIDINPLSKPDFLMDATLTPWIWNDNSVDEIRMHHFLEHCSNPANVLMECYRVLKKDGILFITVPHSSSNSAKGCLFHYRTFSYNSLKDFLSVHNKLFITIHQRLVWLPHWEWLPIQWLIDLSPIFCERFWCYWVGGVTEVQYRGIKI